MVEKARPRTAGAKEQLLTYRSLMARREWKPLPAVALLAGDADFLKELIIKRFTREVFGAAEPDLRRFRAGERPEEDLPLATVLDDLRTPSFFSPWRLVIVEYADAFVEAHAESLLPHFAKGFAGGHLLLLLDKRPDGRTRFARQAAEKGWVVDCPQPYDRPPPWEDRTPIWDSELSHWLTARAAEKGLELPPRAAFLVHQRAGVDLAALERELEKLAVFARARGAAAVDEETIQQVVGDTREDTVFLTVDLFLEGRRAEALESAARLFQRGSHTESGALLLEPTGIALTFMASIITRLRALRRAHAMTAAGERSDEWLRAGLVMRPFLPRFQRQLQAFPPGKIARLFERLHEADRSIKVGGDARLEIELIVAAFGSPPGPRGGPGAS